MQNINELLGNLFQQTSATSLNNSIVKGSLIIFNYSFWKNDPRPLVIVTDYNIQGKMRGVNLHYLTYPYIRNILNIASVSQIGFSYNNIKNDSYISNSFRSYKWSGISQIKKFDIQFINQMINNVRSFDPNQIQSIRQSVNQQLQQQNVPSADALTDNQGQ
jgi:hypothetical protein